MYYKHSANIRFRFCPYVRACVRFGLHFLFKPPRPSIHNIRSVSIVGGSKDFGHVRCISLEDNRGSSNSAVDRMLFINALCAYTYTWYC